MLLPAMQINSSATLSEPSPNPQAPFVIGDKNIGVAQSFNAPPDDPSPQRAPDAPKVLLVDDNVNTLARAKTVLSAACVVVGTVTSGHDALEAAASLSPDVVVLDISMPGMTGFELAQRLRAAGSTAQLVFLTVHEEEELVLAAKNTGALGYVAKRRLGADLEKAVREARAGRPFQSPAR
jgi:CheY-like chemotaxis protein